MTIFGIRITLESDYQEDTSRRIRLMQAAAEELFVRQRQVLDLQRELLVTKNFARDNRIVIIPRTDGGVDIEVKRP
jgi:hypothetical protein